jgi:thiosulfate reductase cytochrome b subunit
VEQTDRSLPGNEADPSGSGKGPTASPAPDRVETDHELDTYTTTTTVKRQYVRFSRLNRTLHIVMIVSFLSLALTGMTLKFSYTDWSVLLSRLFGGFESAGYIHRLAASMMIGVFIIHLVDLVRRKNKEFGSWKSLLFGPTP